MKAELSMLDLSVRVGFLQEHQKRVLSFYIACMMDPDILLLDEPTTGCDPVYKYIEYAQYTPLCVVILI